MVTWQNVVLFALLLAALLVGPKLGADPQMLGTATTIVAAWCIQKKPEVAP